MEESLTAPTPTSAMADVNVTIKYEPDPQNKLNENDEEIDDDSSDVEVRPSDSTEEAQENNNDDDPLQWLYPLDEPPPKKKAISNHHFETDPTVRRRLCNKLFKRLKQILDEFGARIGQQVALIVAQPSASHGRCIKTYGSNPLQEVVSRYHPTIRKSLIKALSQQAYVKKETSTPSFELPPLVIEGNPIPINKMTQAQLREFIPFMLRYSTGRGKPGWGLEKTRPPWWPQDLPWSNIRVDSRDTDSKLQECWSAALRRIIVACYKYHGREDLLTEGTPDESTIESAEPETPEPENGVVPTPENIVVNPDGTVSLYIPENRNPEENEKRHVVLTDTEGHEYFVEIALPANQPALIANFQISQADASLQDIAPASGQVVGLS